MAGTRTRVLAAGAAWAGLAATTAVTLHLGTPDAARWPLLGAIGALWVLFAVAAWLLMRVPARAAVPLLVAGGLGLQALALTVPPRMTDDFYRYAWDGRVQAAHIDPYRYPPTAPELAGLRDEWLFPSGQPRLNHPGVRTIYPPAAEAYFLGLHYLSPPGSRQLPLQAAAGALAVLTTLVLVGVARRSGADPRCAVLWAWCPAVFLEAGQNAHVDVLGALLGMAVAVKLLPALVLPAALARGPHRRRWAVPAAVGGSAATVFALLYLPHVLAVGPKVLGFLPGYLSEEGYGGTGRFALARLLLPDAASPYASALVLAAAAWLAWRTAEPGRAARSALPLTGVAFLLAGPSYPWYALLLVALVALDGRAEWLAVAAAAYPAYFAGALGIRHETMQRWAYGAALAVVLAVVAARRPTVRPACPLDATDSEITARSAASRLRGVKTPLQ
jgi:hypothetical protein